MCVQWACPLTCLRPSLVLSGSLHCRLFYCGLARSASRHLLVSVWLSMYRLFSLSACPQVSYLHCATSAARYIICAIRFLAVYWGVCLLIFSWSFVFVASSTPAFVFFLFIFALSACSCRFSFHWSIVSWFLLCSSLLWSGTMMMPGFGGIVNFDCSNFPDVDQASSFARYRFSAYSSYNSSKFACAKILRPFRSLRFLVLTRVLFLCPFLSQDNSGRAIAPWSRVCVHAGPFLIFPLI